MTWWLSVSSNPTQQTGQNQSHKVHCKQCWFYEAFLSFCFPNKLANQLASLSEHHILFMFSPPSHMSAKLTVMAAAQLNRKWCPPNLTLQLAGLLLTDLALGLGKYLLFLWRRRIDNCCLAMATVSVHSLGSTPTKINPIVTGQPWQLKG